MVAPLTPKPTRKGKALVKAPPTIASRREEDAVLKKWAKPRLCCANGIPKKKLFIMNLLFLPSAFAFF
jgi:hypothetical protein